MLIKMKASLTFDLYRGVLTKNGQKVTSGSTVTSRVLRQNKPDPEQWFISYVALTWLHWHPCIDMVTLTTLLWNGYIENSNWR